MKELNLPPFFVGQKVVCLKTSPGGELVKESIYTVHSCIQCHQCKMWHVTFSECPDTSMVSYDCMCDAILQDTLHFGGPAKYFAPVQENFQSISLEKILETETSLISAS